MAQLAGDMAPGTGDFETWVAADGTAIDAFRWGDYGKRVGAIHGRAGIGRVLLPNRPGWCVCLKDDPDAEPPAGPPVTALDPPDEVRVTALAPVYDSETPFDATAPVALTGQQVPAGAGVEAAVVINGEAGVSMGITTDELGYFATVIDVPLGSFAVRVWSSAYPGATQELGPSEARAVSPAISFDPLPSVIPQGTYSAYGLIDFADVPLEAAIVAPDGTLAEATIAVDPGGRFAVEAYFQTPGSPYRLEVWPTGSDIKEPSASFQVIRAIEIDAIPDVTLEVDPADTEPPTAWVRLGGVFRGAPWEHAEAVLVTDGVEGMWGELKLTEGTDAGRGFGVAGELAPAAEYCFRVRKKENPGIMTESNHFAVVLPA